MTRHRDVRRQSGQETGEVVLVGRRKKRLRRAADAKPRQRRKRRLEGDAPPDRRGGRSDRRRKAHRERAPSQSDRTASPRRRGRRAQPQRVGAQRARIDPGLAEFARVADEPGLDPARIGLDVKLEAERRPPDPERLDRAQRGRGQPLGARRQVAIVAVPVQDRQAVEARERRRAAGVGQRDRPIADLLGRAGRDPRAERRRHELRPEAHPEDRLLPREAAADRRDLVHEKRIGVRFVDADRSPEHDQEIRGHEGLGGEVVDARLDIGERVAFIDQDVAPDADVFERDVADRDGGLRHQRFPSSAASSPGSA